MATAKKKAFGAPGVQIGSGKTAGGDETGSSDKWASAAASAKKMSEKIRPVNVKFVPLNAVRIDPDNPRELSISPNEVKAISHKYPLNKEAIQSEDSANWLESYCSIIRKESGLEGQALNDYINIAEFACKLKSSDKLINPVTGWQDDSIVNLIAGERRYLAHLLLDEEMIKASLLIGQPSDLDLQVMQWHENSEREDLNLHGRLKNLTAIANAYEKTGAKVSKRNLAAVAGIGETSAQRYLVVMRCDVDELHQAIKSGSINNIKKAAELASLPKKQLLSELNNDKPKPAKSSLKLSQDISPKAVTYIINSVADTLEGDDLKEALNGIDLSTHKGLKLAFAALTKHLEEQHG